MTDSSLQAELIALKKEKRKWQAKNNLTQFAHTCNALGEIYSQQGKYEEALDEHEEELDACEKVKDVIGCAVANRKIGECYNELADFEKALTYQHKHLELAQSVNNVIEEQRAWATIGRTYLCQVETLEQNSQECKDVLSKSENAFLKSLDICKTFVKDISQKELMAMKGRLYLNLGLVHDYKGNLNKCADLIKQAIHVNEVYDLKEDLNRCQYSLASIYYRSGNCSQALRIVDEASACAIKLKDIVLQSETLLLKSKILLRINDFDGAKYYLKKAHKFNIPNEIIREEIKTLLKISVNLCKLEKKLGTLPDDDFNGKMILYEKLGDLCAKIECFDHSLNFYNKMLECADVLNTPESEKATIYYSLAETYFDLGKYHSAMDYYHKEIESRTGNFKEQCKSWQNIAECQLKLKNEFHQMQSSHSRALDCAKKANDVRLQVNCIKNLIRLQEDFNIPDEKESNEKLLGKLLSDNDVMSDDEESFTQNLSQNSSIGELTDLSESSSNSEAENEEFDRPKRTSRKASAKKNEKGETALHRACIAGNISQVRRLIEKGHPVNPRDNCGWIPLHEAANHDHYEIVEYLIDKGAWVNDRGGIYCDGITPLHDAASCANFSIMRLLIEHGASVIAKMNDGQTPLDCLKKWRKRVGEDLEQHLVKEYKEMKEKLIQMMSGVDHEYNGLKENQSSSSVIFQNMDELVTCQSDEDEPKQRFVGNQFKKRSMAESVSDDEISNMFNDRKKSRKSGSESSNYEAGSPQIVDSDVDITEEAPYEYINAIDSVRSATSRINHETSPVKNTCEKKLALVNEDDVIVDDWLEDDIGPVTKTNVKLSWPPFKPALKTNVSKKSRFKRPKLRQLKFDTLLKSKKESRATVDDDVVIEEDDEYRENTNYNDDYQHNVPIQPSHQTSEGTANSSCKRVRVRIEGKLLLIPIVQNELEQSVSWLAEEAANRYHQMFGLKPVLRLCAVDGAVLGLNDKVTEVIAGNEEILGNVEQWDLPSLPNRYAAACDALNSESFLNIKHYLEIASVSNELRMLNLCLGPQHLQSTFRALQCQYALTHFSLAGNNMGNKGLQMFADILSTLPNLVHLDLSCNNITNLQCLCDVVKKKNNLDMKPLQGLTDLNLSYNSLDTSITALSTLITLLPLLSRIEIACCSLDNSSINKQTKLVKSFAECTNLRFLNISYNNFTVDGIAALLHSLCANKITSLDFTSVLSSDKDVANNKLAACLQAFISSEKCILEDLSFKDCQISDEVVSQIALCLPHLPGINELNFANNTELSEASLIALTNSFIQNKKLKLQCNVDFSGCMKIIDRLKTPVLTQVLHFWHTNVHKNQLKLKWSSA